MDSGVGECLLRKKENARIIADALLFFNNKRYKLGHWVVMPNHVHVIVTPKNGFNLSEILHSWKSYTSKMINRNMGRVGAFWQDESYDHIVRNLKELRAVEKYICENPGKAGIKSFVGSWNYLEETGGMPRGGEHRQDACATAGGAGEALGEAIAGFVGFDFSNRLKSTERNLPHWNQDEVAYFVTFRTADSIPAGKIEEIKYEREMWLRRVSLMIKNQEEHRQDACATSKSGETPQFDWIIITSPSAVKIFVEMLKNQKFDFRCLPKIIVCGPGTSAEFAKHGIIPDVNASDDYGAEGMIKALKAVVEKGDRVLRLCSDKAGKDVSCELRRTGAIVTEETLYRNVPVKYEKLPEFDAVIFASSSAVHAFLDNFGSGKLKGKYIVAIGKPTLETLKKLKCTGKIILAKEATVNACIDSLAEKLVEKRISLWQKN